MGDDQDPRRWIEERQARADELRHQRDGYAGLAMPFRAIADKLRADLRVSAGIKHPGDKGAAREGLLREFLTKDGYLPRRYAVSEGSSHAVSSSGHRSAQIDLLLYDALNAPRLLSVGGIQYFPIESCYGMVEAKSDLNSRDTMFDGLDKIAAFKRLRPRRSGRLEQPDAFGLLLGYSATLKWSTVFDVLSEWEARNEPSVWPNLVVVLDQGVIAHYHDRRLRLHSRALALGGEPSIAGLGPTSLLTFYLLLLDLLAEIELPRTPIRSYVSLPNTAGHHSYWFPHGAISETGTCRKHGDFLRTMSEASIERLLDACPVGSEVDGAAAMDEAYGTSVGQSGSFGQVNIYNPDSLRLSEVLIRPSFLLDNGVPVPAGESLAFERVVVDGREFWIPHFFLERDSLI